MSEYPKYLYHATEAPVVVDDAKAEKALGAGWHDAPIEDKPKADEKPKGKK